MTTIHAVPLATSTLLKRVAKIVIRLSLLLADTNSSTPSASSLRVLTSHSETPVVSQTTMRSDLLQSLQVLSQLAFHVVCQDLRILAIDNIPLSVQEPGWNFVLCRVLNDRDDSLELFRRDLTSTIDTISIFTHGRHIGFAHRLLRSTSAFLHTKLEYLRPTPLIRVKAYIIFCLPSTLVLRRRKMNWTAPLLVYHIGANCFSLQFDFSPETSDMMGVAA